MTAFDGIAITLSDPSGVDHVFELFYFYRVSGDTSESPIVTPDSGSASGNEITYIWSDLDGRGLLSAILTFELVADGLGATVEARLGLTNISAAGGSITVDTFYYFDPDLANSPGNDSGTLIAAPNQILVSDDATMVTGTFTGLVGVTAFQVDAFSIIRDLLNDGAVDNLDDSGLPFGPADFTGAFQWAGVTIGPGNLRVYSAELELVLRPENPIPTLNLWGLWILGGIVFATGFAAFRRRGATV